MGKHYNVVCAVVVDAGRVFCVKKGKTRFAYTSDKWEFPGGKIEPGESAREALRRELIEEMDFMVEAEEEPLITVEHRYPDFSITMTAFACKALRAGFTLREHVDFCWAGREELAQIDWCDADKPVARAVQETL